MLDCGALFFGRDCFYSPWPAAETPTPASTTESITPIPAIRIISPLFTGLRPSQIFLVGTGDSEPSSPLLVAKFYDPYFTNPEDAITTNPILYTQSLYSIEVATYRHLQHRGPTRFLPTYYGSYEPWLDCRTERRPVYVILLKYIQGCTLIDLRALPKDVAAKRHHCGCNPG